MRNLSAKSAADTVRPGRLLPLAWLAYPFLVHVAVASSSTRLMRASGVLLAALIALPALRLPARRAKAVALAAGAAVLALAMSPAATAPLLLMPVVVTATLTWVFGRTLAPGRTPLIEAMVRALHAPGEDLGTEIPRYARRLTFAWALLCAGLALVNFVLAVLARPGGLAELLGIALPIAVPGTIWSLFANVINYAIVMAFFAGEYVYRRRRFPQQPYRGFGDFTRRLCAVAPRLFPSMPRSGPGHRDVAALQAGDAARIERR